MDVTLDSRYGEGAKARLEQLLDASIDEFQEGACRITWDNGAVLELHYPLGRFVFANYQGTEFLRYLPDKFGKWGVEFGVEDMELVYANWDSMRAFQHIGFILDNGSIMRTTPERLSEYGAWKHDNGPEPEWHKTLDPEAHA